MRRLIGFVLASSLLLVVMAAAQEKPSEPHSGPPKVLTIFREFVKPGKAGMAHEKAESAFVQAFARAKWPTHYFAVNSMSGKPRVLFLTGYDSFAAWEKDTQGVDKNATLSQALDRAAATDGELLTGVDAGTFVYRPDQSLRANVDIGHMRYFEIYVFRIRQGHDKEWEDLAKMYVTGYEKIPDVRWATFQNIYGASGGTFLVFSPLKSLAETDKAFAESKQFEAALGEEGMKKLRELTAAAVESSETNLFQFSPKMSYPPDEWVKADPDFWKPKPTVPAATAKKEGKPKQ